MFVGKNLRMLQKKKASYADLKTKALRGVLKINRCAAAKHKIILPWPNPGLTDL